MALVRILRMTSMVMCISIAMPVFAESAPVCDADTMQEDSQGMDQQQAQYLPPPPSPSQQQEAGSAFIPVTSNVSSAPSERPLSMDQRMQRVEQQMSNMQNSDAATRVEDRKSM